MYNAGGARRFLRRSQRRKRLLIVAVGVVALFFVLLFLAPSTVEPQGTTLMTMSPTTVPPAHTAAPLNTANVTGTARVEHTTQQGTRQSQTETTQEGTRSCRLCRLYAEDLAVMEALDVFAPRPDESRVSFEEFTTCLDWLLDVDAAARTEAPRENPTNTEQLPLLISVTAGNTQDLKAMICNLTVRYKYVVLAQTGDTPEMTPFFDLLTRAFAFTTRLVVLQFKDSIGFAGAVNAGLREALRHPFAEVPFVHIIHNDVRYVGSALAASVRTAYLDMKGGAEMAARLEAEVKVEPSAYTPLIRQPNGLRAPITVDGPLPQQSSRPSQLVTSALLPDRIRYMPAAERQKAFEGHVSMIFHNSRAEYTAVYLSRLSVLTVGFFDENYYPAMFDDTDFRWRAHMLGFFEDYSSDFDDGIVAFDLDCTNTRVDDGFGPRQHPNGAAPLPPAHGLANEKRNAKSQVSPAAKALMWECATAFQRVVQFHYMSAKWDVVEFGELMVGKTSRQPFASEAFGGKRHLPLDAWVVDTRRIAEIKTSLMDTGIGVLELQPYNPEVILNALS